LKNKNVEDKRRLKKTLHHRLIEIPKQELSAFGATLKNKDVEDKRRLKKPCCLEKYRSNEHI